MENYRATLFILIMTALLFSYTGNSEAGVEWRELAKLNLLQEPVDIAISADGGRMYILFKDGNIVVYSSNGEIFDTIKTGLPVKSIKPGPDENSLILLTENKEIKIISVTYVEDIDIAGAPFKGEKDASVTIVVFMDFQCPYCARLAPLLDQVLEKNRGKVKIVAKHFPLKMHEFALMAASISMAAEKKNLFWTYHDLLFKNYNSLNRDKIVALAKEAGLTSDEIEKSMKDSAIIEQIYKDMSDGDKAGVKGIPKVFINGKSLQERTIGGFQKMIDEELKKK